MKYHSSSRNDIMDPKLKEISVKDDIIQKLTNRLACLSKGILPTGGFCIDSSNVFKGGNNIWDGKVCAELEKIFGNSSVGDFGAGLGHYGTCFLRLGGNMIQSDNEKETNSMREMYQREMVNAGLLEKPQVIRSWEGFDGASGIEEISNGHIKTLNLASEVHLDHQFDWVLSLEVGEHIPKVYEGIFIDNLVRHALKGIVLSWAVEGQGGHNHVNTQNNNYVIQKMRDRGLTYDAVAAKGVRAEASVNWFKDTVMVFRFPRKKR